MADIVTRLSTKRFTPQAGFLKQFYLGLPCPPATFAVHRHSFAHFAVEKISYNQ
ncbi:hypothetical protein QIW46_07010 [Pseudomonas fluorescens]|uniref:hypothetical protein n=1 Tax=Pseudomonas TaxID=286 RepID=UPI0021198E0C|nr:hypothetical protein [Pseudomonas siliginis]